MLLFRLIGDQLGPLGWSLYHFLWQGMLVASLYSIARLICGRDMRRRYVLACLFLGVALIIPAWQIWMILNRHHGVSLGIGPPESLLPGMTWVALFLLCIAGTISVRTLLAANELRRVWLDAASEDAELNLVARDVARQLGLKETPRIVRSTAADVMAVIGAAHPVIVVPAKMPACLTEAQFRALLAHEIAHVSRRDPLINFGLSILESFIFFHPAAAWLAGEVRITREYCCDDVAVQSSDDALAYARGLTALAKMPGLKTRAALSANGGDLKARVVRLVSKESRNKEAFSNGKRFIFWLAGAAILVGASKLLCRLM
jgi:beta-lactamase regulating signal transducer with metallopeptidase domain